MSLEPPMGFFGKLPARGDFLRVGLPRSFTDPLDDWLRRALAASRALFGERWAEVWEAAPIWRFALPPGACGPSPVTGADCRAVRLR
jgi:type VI secretion system protein ImpM